MPLCGLQTAAAFRKSVPLLGVLTTVACYYATSKRPALNAEFFSMQPRPVNGTLQVLLCSPAQGSGDDDSTKRQTVCELQVDTLHRVKVVAYRWHLALPFVGCCALGALFGMVAYHDNAQYISSDILFDRDAYAPVHHDGLEKMSLYSWELVWWAYVWSLHIVLVSCVTSPVDIFDTALVVGFGCLALMFLCRPRENQDCGGGAQKGYMQTAVALMLAFCVWLAVTSIPHAYEPDRMWLLSILLGLDGLMLFVHMSDYMPTMYTVLMGRVTYTVLANCALVYAYWVLLDRLSEE